MRNSSGNSYYGSSHACSGGLITGNSVDVNLNQNDSEVRVDIDVARINTIRIWGQVLDGEGVAISNALVKLVKPISMNGTCEFQGVAHCVSDCNGFYQFDVPSNGDYNYKILVGKSAYSNERIICGNNCNGCNNCNNCNNCVPKPPAQPNPCTNPCTNQCTNPCTKPSSSYSSPCDQYTPNYDPSRPCMDSCNSNYEPYTQNSECSNSPSFDSCMPSYKVQNLPNAECYDGDNKYATYYYSEPEIFE